MAKKVKVESIEIPRKFIKRDKEMEILFKTDYFGFCMYVLENRALPSIIDGLKPSARKVIHAGFKILSETKKSPLIDLVGSTLSISKYHHGDSSLQGVIYSLGLDYMDNLAPLELIGSKGDLKSTDSASPRYLSVRLSKYAKIFKQNEHILEYNYDGDFKIEPKYYLPIIPLILTQRAFGIGVGFRYDNKMSYNPISLINESINVLKGKKRGDLIPHINQWSGEFIKRGDSIYCKGKYTKKNNIVVVNEFSPYETFETFEKGLDKLVEKGSVLSFINESGSQGIEYKIKLSPTLVKYDDEKLENTLGISATYKLPKDGFPILNENGKLEQFKNHEDIFDYFVNFRLEKYSVLKEYIINDLKQRIIESESLAKFIDLYLKGKIKISKDIEISETIKQIESFDLSADYIETKLSKLTKDEYNKIINKIKDLKDELEYTLATQPKEMYINDLVKMKKDLEKDFPFNEFKKE